jgi:hypothetical protein
MVLGQREASKVKIKEQALPNKWWFSLPLDLRCTLIHACEIEPRTYKRGVNLISDAFPFVRLWY